MNLIMERIVDECKAQGINQKELAQASKLTEASISRYFNGNRTPNIKSAEGMANALGLKLVLVKR